jgi:dihydroceramide fatty acyl 2-hydroxylase
MQTAQPETTSPHLLVSILTRRFRHPWMPMALYIPMGVLMAALSFHFHPRTASSLVFWILSGVFSWTLIEYFLHRHVFHWTQVKEPWRTLASGLHMAHHRSANTEDLIIAPPVSSLIFGSLVYLLFALITLSFATAALMEIGVFLGYIAYEWVHYGAHRFQPRSPIGKYLKQYHLRHHFKEPQRVFGVTTPLWDFVFGTAPTRKET